MRQAPPTTYKLPRTLSRDIAALRRAAERRSAGKITEDEFKHRRVPMGIYEQRQDGTYMMRVRFPAGAILPAQMRALAEVSRRHGSGILHVTTRQDVQVHLVPLADLGEALVELQAAGLATKGGGGNTVRNVTACSHAGVCPREAFDVSPHCVAVTEFLLPDPASYTLPRKYKVAFSGCDQDCAGVAVHDVGFVAARGEGTEGFVAYAGGGLGARSILGEVLEEFIPVAEAPLVAEAVKRVFHQHGNREDRSRARLRFLVDKIGFPAFRELYVEELAKLRAAAPRLPRPRPLPTAPLSDEAPAAERKTSGFAAWRAASVTPQAQEGYYLVEVPLFLGDVSADTLAGLADVVETHGEGALRATQEQNLALRWVREAELPAVHRALRSLGLAKPLPPILRRLVPCTGAATCRLGICNSRDLAKAIAKSLRHSSLDLAALGDLRVYISGCPNSCGRHPVADIGFSGAIRRVEGEAIPHYNVLLGGRVAGSESALGEKLGMVPAAAAPRLLTELLAGFAASPHCPDFAAFLAAGGREAAAELLAKE